MPVVLMFQHPWDEVTFLYPYKSADAGKWVIRCDPGTPLPQTLSMRLLLDLDEYDAWVYLHYHANTIPGSLELKDPGNYNIVMCQGRINDPLYWSKESTIMAASCGRICRVCDLEQSHWEHTKNTRVEDRIYRCPKCHGQAMPKMAFARETVCLVESGSFLPWIS